MKEDPMVQEIRRMWAESRRHFDTEVRAALSDILVKANSLSRAIGEVSPEEAAAALADYAEERIGQIGNVPETESPA